ncbi:hypothetical protein XENTR_v10016198 [Xenopus tropicalis]|uniref:EF-hand domain family member B n=1 Tax=Xenopus tropicalis TaxID=8364 RepID=A0A6I8Q0K7_XENTR|nr:hypothetical protein XENTR_v10016198 [Xenopus tropicalis]
MAELASIYQGRFIDRSPSIRSAGKLFPVGERAASCLVEIHPRTNTPPVVQKFLNTRRPNPGARRLFYGKANDSRVEDYVTHGVSTRPSLSAGALINLPPKTFFQHRLNDRKEAIYTSHQQRPLGKQPDQTKALPATIDLNEMTFGQKSKRDISASTIINPPKSFQELKEESQKGHQLYVVTHNDYDVGEPKDRKYDCTTYRKNKRFGIETPHFNDGRHVARSLRWLYETKMKERANIVPKGVDNFRERFQHQLGKVCDPIADTMKVPPDHTFGIPTQHEKYGVKDALDFTTAKNFLCGSDKHRAIRAAVHQHFKSTNYENFGLLLEAFRYYDKNGIGKITKEELKSTCVQFGLDLHIDLFEFILQYCEVDKDGLINFADFIRFVNWKDKMAVEELEERLYRHGKKHVTWSPDSSIKRHQERTDESSETECPKEAASEQPLKILSKVANEALDNYRTTSSQISAVVGGPGFHSYRPCGLPSIRTDITPPHFRRLTDKTNYGDESSVFGLLCPSVFSQHMIYEDEFFKSRSKKEIAQILNNIGVFISGEDFEELWQKAAKEHPKGEVSVESIRYVLDAMKADTK